MCTYVCVCCGGWGSEARASLLEKHWDTCWVGGCLYVHIYVCVFICRGVGRVFVCGCGTGSVPTHVPSPRPLTISHHQQQHPYPTTPAGHQGRSNHAASRRHHAPPHPHWLLDPGGRMADGGGGILARGVEIFGAVSFGCVVCVCGLTHP